MTAVNQTRGDQPPVNEGLAAQYFYWHQHEEFRLQRCRDCRSWRHPPTEACPECGSARMGWELACGSGTVFSWTLTHFPFFEPMEDSRPYVCAVVQTEEGPRVLTTLVDLASDAIIIDQPVHARFAEVAGRVLVVFAPIEA